MSNSLDICDHRRLVAGKATTVWDGPSVAELILDILVDLGEPVLDGLDQAAYKWHHNLYPPKKADDGSCTRALIGPCKSYKGGIMPTIPADELRKILDLHKRWINGRADGVRADLTGADLTGANLTEADLTGANLTGANLKWASLTGANLTEADLTGANLTEADLTGANLTEADLTPIRDDLWAVLSAAPAEVTGLRAAIAEGRVDGSTYSGECACLVGTLANVRGCPYTALPDLKPASERAAERFFLAIRKGDTPETSQFSRLALEWVDQWLANVRGAFAPIKTEEKP